MDKKQRFSLVHVKGGTGPFTNKGILEAGELAIAQGYNVLIVGQWAHGTGGTNGTEEHQAWGVSGNFEEVRARYNPRDSHKLDGLTSWVECPGQPQTYCAFDLRGDLEYQIERARQITAGRSTLGIHEADIAPRVQGVQL